MLPENRNALVCGTPQVRHDIESWIEQAVIGRFAAGVEALGPLSGASPALQARLLEDVRAVARFINGSQEGGVPAGYDRRVLYEVPNSWSLAAVILRPGQKTELHDHASWGCAVTVQGIERDRRFTHNGLGNLLLATEHDYPPGTGYLFDPTDVHQPVGADPWRVTVSLHFLVHDLRSINLHPETVEIPVGKVDNAA